MKHGVLFVLLVAAATGCTKNNDDDRPIGTGGPPGGNGGGGDDDGSGTDGGSTTTDARVCLAIDETVFTDPYSHCATGGLSMGAYTLTVGNDPTQITLNGDGTFTPPSDIQFNPGTYWHVSGTGAVSSLVPIVQARYTLPVIATADYTKLLNDTAAIAPTGGAVFVHVVTSAGVPIQGVGATSVPSGAAIIYDAGAGDWSPSAGAKTASTGEIWIPNIVATSVTIELTHGAETAELSNITVANGTNTYVVAVMK